MLTDIPAGLTQTHAMLLAALAAFCVTLTVAWPYLGRDRFAERIRAVKDGNERPHRGTRARSNRVARTRTALTVRQPREVYVRIVERLSLARLADESDLAELLRMAGMRGRAPLVTFLASRVIAALVMPAVVLSVLIGGLGVDWPVPLLLAAFLAGSASGFYLPRLYLSNLIQKRQAALRRSWPDALDLLLICVEAGMSAESAFRKVAEEIGTQAPQLAEELSLLTAELAYLSDRRQAYENLGQRTGIDSIKATVIGLIQSEKYGTSLGQTLRVLAKESRDFRMAAAEKKAASLPPKLTVPMIVFFLPVLFVVIAAPAMFGALEAWK